MKLAILAPIAMGRPSAMWPIAALRYYAAQLGYTNVIAIDVLGGRDRRRLDRFEGAV